MGQRSNQLKYVPTVESTTKRKTLQLRPLQDSHTAHDLHSLSKNAAVSGATATKPPTNISALIARFILTQMLLEAKLSPMNLGDQSFAIEMRSLKRPGYRGVYREQSAKPEALLLVCPFGQLD